jgi:hypothetical protein
VLGSLDAIRARADTDPYLFVPATLFAAASLLSQNVSDLLDTPEEHSLSPRHACLIRFEHNGRCQHHSFIINAVAADACAMRAGLHENLPEVQVTPIICSSSRDHPATELWERPTHTE